LTEAERQVAALHVYEPTVRAFVCYDAERALRQAAIATGPLTGCLIGVKDIIATADFPMRYGTTQDAGGRARMRGVWHG
jgi:Asp-tRNA(Asn)/Glu-tRNA(Gln) amidotransferase A subunit family amidase